MLYYSKQNQIIMKNPKYNIPLLLLIVHFSLFIKGRRYYFSFKHTLLTFLTLLTLQTAFSQWVQQTIPVSKPITGIEFTDTLHGWACTSRGTPADTGYILYTSNGGNNWFVQLSTFGIGFTDIDMLNSLTGYAAGNDLNISLYRLFSTTNGGVNWSSIIMVPNMTIADIQFINKDSAWECGPSFTADVRTTTDGGNTWVVRTSGITQATQKVFFLNYNTGFCGAQFLLYKTTDAGLNWIIVNNFAPENVGSIFYLNESMGWIGNTNRQIFFTSNGGTNWVSQTNPQFFGTVRAIFFINQMTGWAGGSMQYIYKTTNSGQLWGYQIDSAGSSSISFIDTSKGWSGINGISKTVNGGGTIIYVGIIHNNNQVPKDYKLYQNYPNPFNTQSVIRFSLVKKAYVTLKIYDVLGKEKILWQSDNILQSGTHELKLEAKDLSSGVYFYQLSVSNEQLSIVYKETKKMLLIK
jgi:photosystem II stability/assembly factor-like uncharacterized protein